jgi:DNA-binding CsgD family transcriptional regulator
LAVEWVTVGDEDLALISFEGNRGVHEPRKGSEVLTVAEREILSLVLEGASDRDIALTRGRSPRTVQGQLAAIYRKLKVSGRRALRAAIGATAARAGGKDILAAASASVAPPVGPQNSSIVRVRRLDVAQERSSPFDER